MRLKADLLLLLVALIWGSSFAAQRVAADHLGPFLFNGLRLLAGAGVLAVIGLASGWGRKAQAVPERRRGLGYTLLAGLVLFGAGALQQIGIAWTTAGNAGFVTSLYVVLVPILLGLFWRERARGAVWIAAGLAVIGSLLLSTGGALSLVQGDLLVLAGAVFWALHVIVVGRAVRFVSALALTAGMMLVAGLLNLSLAVWLDLSTLPGLAQVWWAVLYTGLFSLGLGFFLQAYGQQVAPAPDAAVILSTESVFAAVFGFLLLGETLTLLQIAGCGLILVAILLAQLAPGRPNPPAPLPGAGRGKI